MPLKLSFSNAETVEKQLRHAEEDIEYLTLVELLGGTSTEQVARTDYNRVALAHYITATSAPAPAPAFPGAFDGAFDEEDDEEEAKVEATSAQDKSLAPAGLAWLNDMVRGNMDGRDRVKFRLFAWKTKGEGTAFSTRFSVENLSNASEIQAPAPLALVPPLPPQVQVVTPHVPDPSRAAWTALEESQSALARAWPQVFQNLVYTSSHVTALQNAALTQAHQLNGRSQQTTEELVGQLVSLKVGVREAEVDEGKEAASTKMRAELGKEFIGQMGSLGRVIASAHAGLPPEVVELAEIVSANPELQAALQNPKVRQMLRDPDNAKTLVFFLNQAVAEEAKPDTQKAA